MSTKNPFPKIPNENLSKRIIIRFSEKDFKNLALLCKKNNVSKSALIRFFVNRLLYPKGK